MEVIVIGAGPAGLAAACALRSRGITFRLFEMGLPLGQRDHDRLSDMGRGVGGCGLFSDGKFSFRPSATKLWELPDQKRLHSSEQWVLAQLGRVGLNMSLIALPMLDQPLKQLRGKQKRYPSQYLSLPARWTLTANLIEGSEQQPETDQRVEKVMWDAGSGHFRIIVQNLYNMASAEFVAPAIICAIGRLGPLWWRRIFCEGPWSFRRIELGVRIEHPLGFGPLASCADLDVKLVYPLSSNAESRTFCSCRNGEVVGIDYGEIAAYSGRGDGPPTGRANLGINIRFLEESVALPTWNHFLSQCNQMSLSGALPLEGVISQDGSPGTAAWPIARYFGTGWEEMRQGITTFLQEFPDVAGPDTLIYAPSIEGVGYYPVVDGSLRHTPFPLWLAGDVTGLFRGNVAALVSGYYTGLAVSEYFQDERL